MTIQNETRGGRALRRLAALALPLMLAAGLGACDLDDVLDVEDPEVAGPESIQDERALPTLYSGAIRDFTWAYSGTGSIGGGGDNDPLITMAGMLTDEFAHYGTFPTRREVDLRDIRTDARGATDNGTLADSYHNLHRARRAAAVAELLAQEFDGPETPLRAVVSSIEGFSYILFGEIYCEGVPYSEVELDGTMVFGSPTTRNETFQLALTRFDRAATLANAAGDDDALYLAQVGRARTLVNMGDYQAAAAAVEDVPDDWAFVVEHSANSAGEQNGVWAYTHNTGRYGLVDDEGGNGLAWSEDPRTPIGIDTRAPFDASAGVFITQMKYPTRDTPVVLADGREARLIEAEAALDAGDVSGFLAGINASRAVDGLDPIAAAPATDAERVDLLFAERGFALWMTAHRLGDFRRLIRQYGRAAGDVFPTGEYFRFGEQYGSDVNFPIYVDEGNNPNFQGCLNRDA